MRDDEVEQVGAEPASNRGLATPNFSIETNYRKAIPLEEIPIRSANPETTESPYLQVKMVLCKKSGKISEGNSFEILREAAPAAATDTAELATDTTELATEETLLATIDSSSSGAFNALTTSSLAALPVSPSKSTSVTGAGSVDTSAGAFDVRSLTRSLTVSSGSAAAEIVLMSASAQAKVEP